MLITANAKINLGLDIVERRADGYHNIETLFYPIALADVIEISPRNDKLITYQSEGRYEVDCAPEANLVVRTCKLFQQQYGIDGVDITLNKFIPFGAGLGGGSSDAANTALALNQIYRLGLDNRQLKSVVSTLGADCAFFIENTPCLASGIGDILTTFDGLSLDGYMLLLVKPDVHVSTKEAYSGVTPRQPQQQLSELLTMPVENWQHKVKNDFEVSVFSSHPELALIKQQLYQAGAVYASMSGSGSTIYGIFKDGTTINAKELFANCFVYWQKLK